MVLNFSRMLNVYRIVLLRRFLFVLVSLVLLDPFAGLPLRPGLLGREYGHKRRAQRFSLLFGSSSTC